MKILYTKIEEFKKNHSIEVLSSFADTAFSTEKRFFEYTIGRYIVKRAAWEIYKIKDTEIIIKENGKPVLKNGEIHFSISHSKNIVAVCFDTLPCGFDIEYIKKRDFKKLSNRYGKIFQTADDFYKFWTKKEAEYKLGKKAKDICTKKFEDEYYIAIASPSNIKFSTPILI